LKKPNIIEIIWHDLGDSLGCYGHDGVRSPSLDQLAREGAVVENMFCTAPQCSPARASIMTGCYPHSVGMLGLAHGEGWEYHGGQRLLTHVLKEHGYACHLVGHHHESNRFDDVPAKTRLGYDTVRALSISDCRHTRVAPAACRFIEGELRGLQPFFLSIGFSDVHRGFSKSFSGDVTQEDVDSVTLPDYIPDTNGTRRDYAEFLKAIQSADQSMAAIFESLRRAGLEEKTIVVFTTDHGPEFNRAKMTLYDPGVKTACIVRFPGRVPEGTRCRGLRSSIDILPTLLDLAEVGRPEFVQGESFAGSLTGAADRGRDYIIAEKTWHGKLDPMRCIRTDRYKYIRNYNHQEPMQVSPAHSLAMGLDVASELYGTARSSEELYDLKVDPHETDNLAERDEHATVKDVLSAKLARLLRETRDPLVTDQLFQPVNRLHKTRWVQRGERFSLEMNRTGA
jgi:arylsulfatase A-like enzyme